MDKPSPLTWKSRAKVDAWNYGYRRPMSAVRIRDEKERWAHVQPRCAPHVNCLDFPPRQPVEDYSWIHNVDLKTKNLPPEHPLSPERMRQREKEEREKELAARLSNEDIPEVKSERDSRSVRSSQWGKDNPNTADFNAKASKKSTLGRKESAFGEVEKFTAHKAGGHFSSKSKSLLEITRKDEIDLQKQRDIAEAKARHLLSGGRLV